MRILSAFAALCLLSPLSPLLAGQRMIQHDDGPELLSSHPLPPPRETPYSNINQPPETVEREMAARGGGFFSRRRTPPAEPAEAQPSTPAAPGGDGTAPAVSPMPAREPETASGNAPDPGRDAPRVDLEGRLVDHGPPSPPEAVNQYRRKLEIRLLERYNNLPEHAGKVAKVSVIVARPPEVSLDGKLIQAEFDQLVYDNWGRRIPALEQEYYVVTFDSGGVRRIRSDPSIRIGLDLEKTYSETAPPAADPFRNVGDDETFRTTPGVRMPAWWRPDFPEHE